jgi:monofunctional glycosyltransferase
VSEPDPLRAPKVFARDYVPPEPPRRRRRIWPWLLLLFLLLVLTPPAMVAALRWLPPPTSAFMLQSPVEPVDYVWVPAAHHPQTLRDAVIAAEDQKFYTHYGFDFEAIAKALEHNEKNKKKVRGASTITQQVAKNLFLWPSRSYLRKGLEVTFTVLLELMLPKDRILEIYLNIAEFGPGVYGAEAAARKFFDRSAQELSPAQSARLAAVLPNPRKWHADRPGPYVQSRVDWILAHIGYGPVVPEPESTEPIPSDPQGAEPSDEALEPAPDETGEPAELPAEPAPEMTPAEPSTDPYAQDAPPAQEPAPDQPAEPVPEEAPAATPPPPPKPAY